MGHGTAWSLLKFGVLGGMLDLCFSPDCNLSFSQSVSRYPRTNMVGVRFVDQNTTVITEKLDHQDAIAFAVFVKEG